VTLAAADGSRQRFERLQSSPLGGAAGRQVTQRMMLAAVRGARAAGRAAAARSPFVDAGEKEGAAAGSVRCKQSCVAGHALSPCHNRNINI
jgi:hypothetical protein